MGFLSVLLAFLLEQARPLGQGNVVHRASAAWVRWCQRVLDTGEIGHAWMAWALAVLVPTLLSAGIYWLCLLLVGWPLAVAWCVLALYATLGFRQFSFHFTQIRDALLDGNDEQARRLLAEWEPDAGNEATRSEIVADVIALSVLAAHRHVFGVLVWFSLLAALGMGPAGAVLYRLGESTARYVRGGNRDGKDADCSLASTELVRIASRSWAKLDWLPARATAVGFAIVGNFEEAIDGWRRCTQCGVRGSDVLILAATQGAMDVDLGGAMAAHQGLVETADNNAEPQSIRPQPQMGHLPVVVGMVWRTVVLWVILLALLSVARLLG
ncbi:adenosylcobinamide-phosphate synthase [Candidatus Symbiobacter mobilis]|uniref:Adenosylcobinamide-phosphate synthase n=1 Tax=Candidatus Symbiobacter mobilis CR TaxID=946483 RepID=U5N9D1_9BURK|nr:adenosylcobinamide-phosphate synthase [Candidatus Symbiobacter mobilis]AGX87915.1 adenosylcobinamide-phosphate synthase [Candidatus Symbiobacter mobilis CR]